MLAELQNVSGLFRTNSFSKMHNFINPYRTTDILAIYLPGSHWQSFAISLNTPLDITFNAPFNMLQRAVISPSISLHIPLNLPPQYSLDIPLNTPLIASLISHLISPSIFPSMPILLFRPPLISPQFLRGGILNPLQAL